MDRTIEAVQDHVIVCGWGRVGRAIAHHVADSGRQVVVVDHDAERLYVTLSGRSLQPGLFIIASARDESSEAKLRRAGADRVVNPQAIGGARMAAFVSQPNVAEFLDVVMHDRQFEFQLAEVTIDGGSPLAGETLRDAHIRERTGALILALRTAEGAYLTKPGPDTVISAGQILICIGTAGELAGLHQLSRFPQRSAP